TYAYWKKSTTPEMQTVLERGEAAPSLPESRPNPWEVLNAVWALRFRKAPEDLSCEPDYLDTVVCNALKLLDWNDIGLIRKPEGRKGGEGKAQIQDQKLEADLKALTGEEAKRRRAEKRVRDAIGANSELIELFERSLKTGVGQWEVTD